MINQTLKHEIEKAIVDSLDSESAKIALSAINPYFNVAPTDKTSTRILFPPIDQNTSANKQGRTLRSNFFTRLPNVNLRGSQNNTLSARDISAASPASVRSTQSEPIGETFPIINSSPQFNTAVRKSLQIQKINSDKNLHIQATVSPNNHRAINKGETEISNSKPMLSPKTYNTNAVIDLLRRERISNARIKISKITGWAQNLGEEKSSQQIPQIKRPPSASTKIEQVKLMKAVYMSNSNLENEKMDLPPRHPPQQPQHLSQNKDNSIAYPYKPVVIDIEMNESALGQVSKYFTSTAQSHNEIEKDNSEEDLYGEDLGVESLLKWSSQLNVDEI